MHKGQDQANFVEVYYNTKNDSNNKNNNINNKHYICTIPFHAI